MYQNRISLIGFTGKDAETRSTKNQTAYAVLSLATKTSYKDKKSGEYISHTEWHRIVVWGKLGEFAVTLKKGAHLLVEGEVRSRTLRRQENSDVQRRVWEVRADSDPEARPRRTGPHPTTSSMPGRPRMRSRLTDGSLWRGCPRRQRPLHFFLTEYETAAKETRC